jgi:outer membrane receptor protein involved in Fe transport
MRHLQPRRPAPEGNTTQRFPDPAMRTPLSLLLAGLLVVLVGVGPARAQQPQQQQRPAGAAPGGAPGALPSIPTLISGVVQEAGTNEPLEAATVSVWAVTPRDTTLATGTITDERGRFSIPGLRPGRYSVRVSYVGYRSVSLEAALRPDAMQANLGTIRLSEGGGELAEVQVEGERETIQIGIDRTIYNTKDQPAAAGGNATDVLRNVPSVDVDAEGKVSLRGNQNVAILINGRPTPVSGQFLTSFLQSIPAGNVSRVEVIPNPSARYEPDGMAGMLNIVLKENVELGLSGNVNAGVTSLGGYNGGVGFTGQRGKWTGAVNYGYRRDPRELTGLTTRTRFTDGSLLLGQADATDVLNWSHLGSGSVDYKLSDHNTLSATGLVSRRAAHMDVRTENSFGSTNQRHSTLVGDMRGWSYDGSLAFRRIVAPQQNEVTAEVRFNDSVNDDLQRFNEQAMDAAGSPTGTPFLRRDARDNHTQTSSAQLDVIRPVSGFKVETGLKGTLRTLRDDLSAQTSVNGQLQNDAVRSLDNGYEEQVYAGYVQASRQVGKVSFQAGVRLEQALTDLTNRNANTTTENDYFSVFPSAFVNYAPTPARQFKVTYSKRVNRPQIFMLSSVPQYLDQYNIRVGNPTLKPEYTHAFEAGFNAFAPGRTLSVTPFFRRTVNAFRPRIEYDQATNVTTQTFRNYSTNDSYGLEVVGTLRPNPKANLSLSGNASRIVTDGSNVEANLTNRTFMAMLQGNATYTVRPGTDLQLTAMYRSPVRFEQFRASGMLMTNLALQQKLLKDKATLGLRVSDPLGIVKNHYRGQIESLDVVQEGDRRFQSRAAFVTFTYNFGQPPRQRPRPVRPSGEQQPDNAGGFGF